MNRGSDSASPDVDKLTYEDQTYDGDEMLLGWQLYFTALSSPSTGTPSDDYLCEQNLESTCSPCHDVVSSNGIHLTSLDINKAIKLLKMSKAAGIDNVSPEHLKYLGDTSRHLILTLFNTFLHHAYCPKAYKERLILPLHKGKGKDPHDPRNYRGITLTSVLCKLLEVSVKSHIERQLYASNIPDELQFEFRKEYSCALPSLSLEFLIELNTVHKLPTYLALLLEGQGQQPNSHISRGPARWGSVSDIVHNVR